VKISGLFGEKLMKRLFIFTTFFLLLFFLACPSTAQEMTGPRMVLEEKVFAHEDVEQGATVEHVFKVRNPGTEILEIKKVVPG
jgi:hypothetical protein